MKATVLSSWNFPAKTPTTKILSKLTTAKCKSKLTEKRLEKESLNLDPPATKVLDGKDGCVVTFGVMLALYMGTKRLTAHLVGNRVQ